MNDFFRDMNRALDEHLTPAVKKIILINAVITILTIIMNALKPGFSSLIVYNLSMVPYLWYRVWQYLTYFFLHVDIFHVFFNMMVLWFFGPPLESMWGRRQFWSFYLLTGLGAGLLYTLAQWTMVGLGSGRPVVFVLGASGATMGVMLAFAAYEPNRMVLFMFVMPMKIVHLVIVLAAMSFLFGLQETGAVQISSGAARVSHLTHFTGLVAAYAWLAYRHKDWDIRHWRWRPLR